MRPLEAYGLRVVAPAGWEARIFRHPDGEPTVHAATFQLPLRDGEFGSSAMRRMARDDAFLSLTEYRADERLVPGRGLFAPAQPRRLRPASFRPQTLLLHVPGRLGAQVFFSARERPFALYVVMGSRAALARRLAEVNALLASLVVATGRTTG